MNSVFRRLESLVERHPERLLFSFLDERAEPVEQHTYGTFHQRVELLASHLVVPAHGLCAVPPLNSDEVTLPELSVLADAVTTPYQSIERSGLTDGDVAVFVGCGGVGVSVRSVDRQAWLVRACLSDGGMLRTDWQLQSAACGGGKPRRM